MYDAIVTCDTTNLALLAGWAQTLGWTVTTPAESPYSGGCDGRYCAVRLTGKSSENLLQDLHHLVETLAGEGIIALREQIICSVYDSKTGEDWISESDDSEQRAVETAAEGVSDGE